MSACLTGTRDPDGGNAHKAERGAVGRVDAIHNFAGIPKLARERDDVIFERRSSGDEGLTGAERRSGHIEVDAIKDGDRIRLKDVEVQSKYVKEQNKTYYNFVIRAFETVSEYEASKGYGVSPSQSSGTSSYDDPVPSTVDDGELDVTSDKLPF